MKFLRFFLGFSFGVSIIAFGSFRLALAEGQTPTAPSIFSVFSSSIAELEKSTATVLIGVQSLFSSLFNPVASVSAVAGAAIFEKSRAIG